MIDRIGITECPNALWGNDLFLDRIFLDRINRIYRIGIAGGWNTSPVIARSVATKQPSRSLDLLRNPYRKRFKLILLRIATPKGLPLIAQGCAYPRYPGDGCILNINPNGVASPTGQSESIPRVARIRATLGYKRKPLWGFVTSLSRGCAWVASSCSAVLAMTSVFFFIRGSREVEGSRSRGLQFSKLLNFQTPKLLNKERS